MKTQSIKKPVMKGHAKVPVIMQLEMLECGAASLAMIMGYYEKWITLEQARVDCGVSRDGSNAKNIMMAARKYGMIAKAYRLEPEDLKEEGPYPCIIHWGFNHFVVLNGFRGNKVDLNDPARGHVVVPWEEFNNEFTGICITIEPGEDFEPEGKRKSVLEYAKERLHGTGAAVAFVILTTTITTLLGIIQPIFDRIFLDHLLSGKNPNWFTPFMLAVLIFELMIFLMTWISEPTSRKIAGKMDAVGSSSYLWRILRLPMQFFGQRLSGDLANRQATNATIASSLVNTFAPLLIQTASMILYLIIMLRYSILLTCIGVGAIILNLIVSNYVSMKRINITRVQMRDNAKLSSTTVSGVNMIETIKASGAEQGFFARWAGFQASVTAQQVRFARLNQWLGTLPALFTALANLAVLGFGVYLVLEGQFQIGMIMAFQGFLSSFMGPANSLISASQSMQEMITDMERVDDVMSYPLDPWFEKQEKTEEYQKLTGEIRMENITFGYSRLAPPLIEDFSMTIHPGQKIAFVGRSGCGKSTLTKLLTGLYQPWSGKITYDGKELNDIDRHQFTGSVSVIDQDIMMFEDSISDNIRMWDSSIEDFEVIMAAKDAGIHDDIVMRDGGYQHKLQEGGKDFSGGQRQRMEIARALAQDPTICILDEATSALDARTEHEVVKAITDRGVTCIIIAHRLSTIRDCDEIIVLEHGKVVERGTHEQLMKNDGQYKMLVTSE